jgi:hypothetical protein
MSQRESFEENYQNCRAREGTVERFSLCVVRTRSGKVLGAAAVLQSAHSPYCVLRFCPIFRARIIMYAPLWEFQSKQRQQQVFHLSFFHGTLGMRKSLHVNRLKWHVAFSNVLSTHGRMHVLELGGRVLLSWNKIEQFRAVYTWSNYGQ